MPLAPDAVAALRSAKQIYVATRRADGTPSKVVPVWFILDGEAVYFTTGPESHKARRIARGSPLLVWVGRPDGPHFVGRAELVRARAARALEWLRAARVGHGLPRRRGREGRARLPRLDARRLPAREDLRPHDAPQRRQGERLRRARAGRDAGRPGHQPRLHRAEEHALRLRDRRPGRVRGGPGRRRPDDRLRLPLILRGVPEAGLDEVRPPGKAPAPVPDPPRRLPDRLSQRPLGPDLRLDGEGAPLRGRGPPRPSRHVPRAPAPAALRGPPR